MSAAEAEAKEMSDTALELKIDSLHQGQAQLEMLVLRKRREVDALTEAQDNMRERLAVYLREAVARKKS